MRWGGRAEADAAGCSWGGAREEVRTCRRRLTDCLHATRESASGADCGGACLEARLRSPSPPRAESSECGLTASGPSLCDAAAQTEGAERGEGAADGRSAGPRDCAREELKERKALANSCGSELCSLFATALRQEAGARAAEGAALRAQLADARCAAARAQAAEREAKWQREAAREQLRRAIASQHAAQAQRAELAQELSVALRQQEDARGSMRAQQQSSAQQELRFAAEEAQLRGSITRLREELAAVRARCRSYEQEHTRRREWLDFAAAEEAAREALELQASGGVHLLGCENGRRMAIVRKEASLRSMLCYKRRYTGPAAKSHGRMPANEALMVNTVCHGVAVFVPEDWAPVCSTTASAALAVMRVHSQGWMHGEMILGPFRSRGRDSDFDERVYGPEPGMLHAGVLQMRTLIEDILDDESMPWTDWTARWCCHIESQANLYENMRIHYKRLWLSSKHLASKATSAVDRIEEALTLYDERTEAESGAE
eukprot:TRINITY_DN6093_c0_g1_i1.p1 TRINITY_DN6093_c0_g1~~TRINITY_DN6093_c0_g1_i1.p1  ORF type:complete len:520 (+),score=109.05 TRINITY_DN6093_c0_g1_i1:92-1561(+)